jgi:hypothetical protein
METMMQTFKKTGQGGFVRYPKNTESLTVDRDEAGVVYLRYRFNQDGYDLALSPADARALATELNRCAGEAE